MSQYQRPEECYHWRSDLVNGGEIGEIHDKYFFPITDLQTSLASEYSWDDEMTNRRSLTHSLLCWCLLFQLTAPVVTVAGNWWERVTHVLTTALLTSDWWQAAGVTRRPAQLKSPAWPRPGQTPARRSWTLTLITSVCSDRLDRIMVELLLVVNLKCKL